jgi:hypothetical protein
MRMGKENADLSTALRSPGFPVEVGGVGALHAAFLNESSTRGHVQRCVAGNPGPVEMTIHFLVTTLVVQNEHLPCNRIVISTGGVMSLRPTEGDEKRLVPATTLYGIVTLSLSSRPELPWASDPPKVMKNASVQQPLSKEPSPFPLSSRAKPRDLQFRGPFVEMFFDRA